MKGGPCQGSNLSRRTEAWANVAGRDMGRAGLEVREERVHQAKDLQVIRAIGRFSVGMA